MNPADFSSIPELSSHLLQDGFSAIVQGSGYGELLTDLGICDHEQFTMFNPIFGEQPDDHSGFDGAASHSTGFENSRQTKLDSEHESAFAHTFKSSTKNPSSGDHTYAHEDGDEQSLSWNRLHV